MKRIVCFILALTMLLALCGCGKSASDPVLDPLSADYSSVDEVVAVLLENYTGTDEQKQAIAKNESIRRYFQEDHIDDEIWEKLYEAKGEDGLSVISLSKIYVLYDICNAGDWFNYLNVGSSSGLPFIKFSDNILTEDVLKEKIKDKFRDPDSVTIEDTRICFELPQNASDSGDFVRFDENCGYVIYANIRAKNGFGAYDISTYKISGRITGSGWSVSKVTEMGYTEKIYWLAEPEGYTSCSVMF